VKPCKGAPTLEQTGPAVGGQQPPAGWEQRRGKDMGCRRERVHAGTKLPYLPLNLHYLPLVSPVFCRDSFINDLSSIYNCYEFARCPQPLAASGTLLVTSGVLWFPLSLTYAGFTCLCKHQL